MKKKLPNSNKLTKEFILRILSFYYKPVSANHVHSMLKAISINRNEHNIRLMLMNNDLIEYENHKFIIRDQLIREKYFIEFFRADNKLFTRYGEKILYYSQGFLSYQSNHVSDIITIARVRFYLDNKPSFNFSKEFYDYGTFVMENYFNHNLNLYPDMILIDIAFILFIHKKILNFEKVDIYFEKFKKLGNHWEFFENSNFAYLISLNHLMKGELTDVKDNGNDFLAYKGVKFLLTGKYPKAIDDLKNRLKQLRKFSNDKNPLLSQNLNEVILFFSIIKYPKKYTPLHNSWYAINKEVIDRNPLISFYLKHIKDIDITPVLVKKENSGITFLLEIITYCSLTVVEDWDIDIIIEVAYRSYHNEYYWVALELFYLLNQYNEVKDEWKEIYKFISNKIPTIIPISSFVEYRSNKEYIFSLIEEDINNQDTPQKKKIVKKERVIWKLIEDEYETYNGYEERVLLEPHIQKILKSGKWGRGRKISIYNYDSSNYENVLSKEDIILMKNLVSTYEETEPALRKSAEYLPKMDNIYNDYNFDNNIVFKKGKYSIVIYDTDNNFRVKIKDSDDFTEDITKNSIIFINPYLYKVVILNNSTLRLLNEIKKGNITFNKDEVDKLNYWIENNKTLDIESSFYIPKESKAKVVKPKMKVVFNIEFDDKFDVDIKISPYPDFEIYFPNKDGLTIVEKDKNDNYITLKRDVKKEQNLIEYVLKRLGIKLDKKVYRFNVENYDLMISILENAQKVDELELRWKESNKKFKTKKISSKDINWKIKSKNNWFEIEGLINFSDNEQISLNKFLLKNMKDNFLILKNGDIISLTKEFKDKVKKIDKSTVSKDDKLLVPSYISKDINELLEEGKIVNRNKQWKTNLEKFNSLEKQNIKIPAKLNKILRDYQKVGVKWLSKMTNSGFGVCLADDMGLGKTIQAIASISINPAKTVIIVPASVVYNWKDEINRFAPELKPFIYEGKNKKDLLKDMDKFTIIIVSYDTFQRDAESFYKDNWGWIILDEAQKIKNPTTRRSKAIFKLEGEKRVALSGTPIENHLGELWSLFHFLDPILLGDNKNFNNIFVKPILNDDKGRKVLLKNILSTFLLRRLKKDVLKELPDKTEMVHWVNFNSKEKTYYEVLRREALKDLKGNKDSKGVQRIKILAHLTKLRQASCDISLAGEKISKSSKTEEAIKLINNILESKHKTLVFSQFTSYFKLFKKELDNNNIKYLYLDGSTPKKKRAQLVKKFESDNESVFLISLKAGGTGLNLTSANYVIHLDPWWNPAVEDQATDRTHRIGQSKNVTVYKMIVKNSIEEKIIALHKSKKELSNSILDNMDKPQNKLSIDDLMKMLK